MSMEITFELSDADLEYFKEVMLNARKKNRRHRPGRHHQQREKTVG